MTETEKTFRDFVREKAPQLYDKYKKEDECDRVLYSILSSKNSTLEHAMVLYAWLDMYKVFQPIRMNYRLEVSKTVLSSVQGMNAEQPKSQRMDILNRRLIDLSIPTIHSDQDNINFLRKFSSMSSKVLSIKFYREFAMYDSNVQSSISCLYYYNVCGIAKNLNKPYSGVNPNENGEIFHKYERILNAVEYLRRGFASDLFESIGVQEDEWVLNRIFDKILWAHGRS